MTTTNKLLFDLIKEHKWDEFMKTLSDNSNIDVNVRDNSNNYLIHYAVLLNRVDIVKLLISRNCKIDIIDEDNRSLLYVPIKYNYHNMLTTLLSSIKSVIGVSLVDLLDKNSNIPLHYALYLNNKTAVTELLKHSSNISIRDTDGNNSIHLAIKYKNTEIFKMLLEDKMIRLNNNLLNLQNKNGETPLHIACNYELADIVEHLLKYKIDINIKDHDHQLTPLIYSIVLNNNTISTLLIQHGADINMQDYNGNTCVNYSVLEDNEHIYNLMIKQYFNFNVTNIFGKTLCHIIIENSLHDISILNKYEFSYVLERTNINIQDNNGDSVLHILCRSGYWTHYIDILHTHKNNIYVLNRDNKTPIDYIKPDKVDEFYDIIATSYINTLRQEANMSVEWKHSLDMACKREVKYIELKKIFDEIETKKASELYDLVQRDKDAFSLTDYDGNRKDVCKNLVKRYIITHKLSIPVKNINVNIDIDIPKNEVTFVTYTGAALDVLTGLIYLQEKHSIGSSLTPNFIKNDKLEEYHERLGLSSINRVEYLNFEIIWVYQKLFFPTNFFATIQTYIASNKYKFILIPIGIELANGSHANSLLYDLNKNEIERFEPNGADYPYKFNYNPSLLDSLLEDKFKENISNIKYIPPAKFLPKIGFQLLESNEHFKDKRIGDPGGFCAAWSLWWADMRLTYNTIPREVLSHKLIKRIKETNMSFRNVIRSYSKNVTDIRDKLLKHANLDINDWLNENYTDEQLNKINKKILDVILQLM
ncbi:MAG: ankyrin repeat protein [Faunusvirus sp.]|jgi:ankyrin repeat protein|uniref:Ankyrin repeat protein n=1 Tax=Faunusvirus sp. TaxID=2487766 RepID=A0A3G4ZXB5_9VIRU|nr:MAG: ankyrin repeat protein [Faunusvirus sp.]